MLILKYIDKSEYEAFVLNNSALFHSIEWAEFLKAYYRLTPHYLGLMNDSKLEATILLLQKEIDSNYSYFFIPDDIVFENESTSLSKAMYSRIKQFIRKKKGVFIQQLSSQSLSWKENKLQIDYSLPLQYKIIDLSINNTVNYLENKINNEKYISIEVYKGTKKDLINLALDNKIKYYETLYEVLNSSTNTNASIFVERIHISTTINNLERRMKEINTQISILPIDSLSESAKKKYKLLEEQKLNINEKINKYKKLKREYKNDTILFANLLLEFGKKAWIIFDNRIDILEDDIIGYNTYLEEIKHCKNNGIEILYAPFNINDDDDASKVIIKSYENIINYLLYLWPKRKIK